MFVLNSDWSDQTIQGILLVGLRYREWSWYFVRILRLPHLLIPASPIASNYPFNEQWAPLAREHLLEENYGASQHKHATKRNAMKTNCRKCQTAHALPLLEPAGFSQLVLVLDL